jgi:hypothetical protein
MVPLLVAFGPSSPAKVEDRAELILRASHDCVAAHSVEIEQTVEQTARLLVDGKPSGAAQTTKQTSVIEIDAGKKLVRMTTKDAGGKELIVLRKGKRIAMKAGSGPWTAPKGPEARLGDQLANPFACPLPRAGDENSPKWKIAGSERLDGKETTAIETVGDTANKYALERMREGIAAIFPDADARPTIEVLAYKARHWIGEKDDRRLRVEQTSHQKMTMPGGAKAVIDMSGKTIAVYRRYDQVEIRVPEEAQPSRYRQRHQGITMVLGRGRRRRCRRRGFLEALNF